MNKLELMEIDFDLGLDFCIICLECLQMWTEILFRYSVYGRYSTGNSTCTF